MGLLQFRDTVVRIHLCGGQTRMTEQFFDCIQVSTFIQKMCSKRVTQDVRAPLYFFGHLTKLTIYHPEYKLGINFNAFLREQ